jgi:hypothetical protein
LRILVVIVVVMWLVVVFGFVIRGNSRGGVEIVLFVGGIAKVLVEEGHREVCCVERATPRR